MLAASSTAHSDCCERRDRVLCDHCVRSTERVTTLVGATDLSVRGLGLHDTCRPPPWLALPEVGVG
jgi:hypothetical protein